MCLSLKVNGECLVHLRRESVSVYSVWQFEWVAENLPHLCAILDSVGLLSQVPNDFKVHVINKCNYWWSILGPQKVDMKLLVLSTHNVFRHDETPTRSWIQRLLAWFRPLFRQILDSLNSHMVLVLLYNWSAAPLDHYLFHCSSPPHHNFVL